MGGQPDVFTTPGNRLSCGPLDGNTVLRFAHAYESGGGTERYLDDLDCALLERNAMTIVRLHLTRRPAGYSSEETIGRGRLVRIALPVVPGNDGQPETVESGFRFQLKRTLRDQVICNPLAWTIAGAKWTASLRLPHQPGQAVGAGNAAAGIFRARRVNLAVLHFFGGADADEVMTEAKKFQAPVALLNHFSNDRFQHLAIRKHLLSADGVAGVNGLGLPRHVRDRFTNLSDGIDTDFFRRKNARPPANPPSQPVILLPARVVREKGQLDLLRAAVLLRQSGIECCLVFAGRVDSSGFVNELQQAIVREGMTGNVRFLGELGATELRDWYAASAVAALPTRHHEGLPRVILEAQAMGVPVVAYNTGGVADGIASGRTGYLLPVGDISGLANRLRELLASPSLRESMGTRGREAAESRFSLAALADRHERFYAKIIAASKSTVGGSAAN